MDLNCLNDIITDNLAIQIDLTDLNSWDLNTGLTTYSINKWSKAISDNIELIDFGLTGFDNGRTDNMWSGITLTPNDTQFSMYRVGYNNVHNPSSGETSGMTITTTYLPISGITNTGGTGNYYELAGGYLQGFFKLDGYNYELLPSRYNNGITIETLIYLYPNSNGIFYMMGARAEDKYNPYFSGETTFNGKSFSGVTTSENNYLTAIKDVEKIKNGFSDYNKKSETIYENVPQSANTINNVIAFEITEDKKLAYKYINENNQIVTNTSTRAISPTTGWTIIAISFTPDTIIDDPDLLDCYPQRNGEFIIYVNGRPLWIIKDYPEFFFKAFQNDREKQIGLPYSISWGGGSFGLKHSWHYDIQKYRIYTGNDQNYINTNFIIESNPFPEKCDPYSGETILDGLSLSADSSTFKYVDECNSNIEHPITVMRVEYTGATSGMTGQTGTSATTYFIKFNQPITVLSNRVYEVNLNLYVNDFFKSFDNNNNLINNTVSLLIYGTEDIDIISEEKYIYPLTENNLIDLPNVKKQSFPDKQEYEYILSGISYYGVTGVPAYDDPSYYTFYGVSPITKQLISGGIVTGQNKWLPLQTKFKIKNNTGKQTINIGILIKTTDSFNKNKPLFISDFTYKGADILLQDPRKNNLLIQQNFDSSFNGRLQKLRIYDRALLSSEILHNALMEMKKNPNLNLKISKGGRLIYK